MTLDTAYPRSEDLWVDPRQRIVDANAGAPVGSRYSRLSILLVASLALHLSFLTALGLWDTVPPRPAVTEPIKVELVTEPPAAPKDKAHSSKKSDATIGKTSKSSGGPGKKSGDKPAAAEVQKAEEKSVAKPETKPETNPHGQPQAKPDAKPEAKKEPPPKAQAPAQPEPKPPQAEPPKNEKPQPEKLEPQKPAATAAKPAAAPKPPPPPTPEAKAAPKPQPAEAKPATPQPQQPPEQQLPPWERPPSAQATAATPQLKPADMGVPINQQAQEAVAVPMPSAGGDLAMSYETIVSGKLALSRRFPPEARARGAHGSAMIAFLIDSDGKVSKIKLLKSSGDTALDVESLAMVMRAAPFPPPPPGAEREFAIMVDFDPKQ